MNSVQVIEERYRFILSLLKDIDDGKDVTMHDLGSSIKQRFSETAQAEAERRTEERKVEREAKWMTLVKRDMVELSGIYSGPMTIKIMKEFWAPDLYVHIDPNGVHFNADEYFQENRDWHQIIIGALQEAGYLDANVEYNMWSAESGMQSDSCHCFEGIARGSHWVSTELFLKWGAVNKGDT